MVQGYLYSAHTGESPSMYTLTLMRTLVGGFTVYVHKLPDLLSMGTMSGNCKRRKSSISPPTRRTRGEVTSDLDQQMIQCTQSTSGLRAAQYAQRSWPHDFYRNSMDMCTVACTIARVVRGGHGHKLEDMCTSFLEHFFCKQSHLYLVRYLCIMNLHSYIVAVPLSAECS